PALWALAAGAGPNPFGVPQSPYPTGHVGWHGPAAVPGLRRGVAARGGGGAPPRPVSAAGRGRRRRGAGGGAPRGRGGRGGGGRGGVLGHVARHAEPDAAADARKAGRG